MRRSRYGREVAVMPQNVAERVAKRGGILRVRNWQRHHFIGIDTPDLFSTGLC